MITISSGHWTIGTGAKDIIDEVTESRKVSKRLFEILHAQGIEVNYIVDDVSKNQQQNLSYLVAQHNKTNRALDVSIHFNAFGDTQNKGFGTEVLYYSEKDLATKVSKAISSASGLIDRGAKERKELAFLSKTDKPAILIEVCFVNSTVDVAIYRRDFEKICQSIASALASHVKVPAKTEQIDTVKLLTPTGRTEIRELLKWARYVKIIGEVHTDAKINSYSDAELLSYQAAVINRRFK